MASTKQGFYKRCKRNVRDRRAERGGQGSPDPEEKPESEQDETDEEYEVSSSPCILSIGSFLVIFGHFVGSAGTLVAVIRFALFMAYLKV